MRKLILISALLLASASAQAGPSAGPLLAAAEDTPAATTTDTPQPLPPVSQTDALCLFSLSAKIAAQTGKHLHAQPPVLTRF